jgi:hypothetical protein
MKKSKSNLPARLFVLEERGYNLNYVFTKTRAKRCKIKVLPSPIACINNRYTNKSYFVYLPDQSDPNFSRFVELVENTYLNGYYPSWETLGIKMYVNSTPYDNDAELNSVSDKIPDEKVEAVKKLARKRLDELRATGKISIKS